MEIPGSEGKAFSEPDGMDSEIRTPATTPPMEPKRLHPLTMVQRVIVSLPALVFIMLPVLRSGDSTAWFNLIFGAMYLVFIVPWIALHYLRFRYWITSKELVIHSGVLTRRRRNIPLERIQNIEIEQAPLQRMLGTAKVIVYTAGSARAEGVLEYVSIGEARDIRTVVRNLQQQLEQEETASWSDESLSGAFMSDETLSDEPLSGESVGIQASGDLRPSKPAVLAGELLIALDTRRVFLAGAFRFSLVYLAVIFSFLQYIEPDPTLLFSWLMRGPLEPLEARIDASPVIAAVMGVFGAMMLGWLTGVLVTFNRYHRFKLELIGDKLHRSHGLLTLKEGTIPLSRVQSWILRTNPLMEAFGWVRLEVQTMGINIDQSGYQVAMPFGRMEEVAHILAAVGAPVMPENWSPVSRLTIRRFLARSHIVLLFIIGIVQIWWSGIWWLGVLSPVLLAWSFWRYHGMRVADDDFWVAMRKGVIRRQTWLVPIRKLQTAGWYANWFQRRLGLASIYVDTAGASSGRSAELPDIEKLTAQTIVTRVYDRFQSVL